MKTCEYYFSPQSPFAYLGHARLMEMAQQHGVQIEIKPADLGKVFSLSGGVPLAKRAPQRQAYRLLELQRWSEYRKLPLNLQPKFFPVSGETASKLIIATKLAHGTDAALILSGALMRAVWVEDRNIADTDTLAAISAACGHDGKELVKAAETASVQTEYDRFTDEAIAANVFGAPWYVVDGQGYWGQDRLDFVERAFAK
jgi:2-hydroxychromene-2-carboxylate isomerase